MIVKYVDYETNEMKELECFQVIFSMDKDFAFCFRNVSEAITDSVRILKTNIQYISD